jgi:cystathionine beta-lyase/cystathionine gamma-synthase
LIAGSLAKEIAFLQNAEGSGLAPFDCWLCLRGIKTMALRVEKQQVKLFCNLYAIYLFTPLSLWPFHRSSKDA